MSETTLAGTQATGGQTRTARKRRAILDAATTLFLRDGYLATSMDQIAAAAAVSKQTLYKQFADKQSLFREIVTATVAQVSDPVAEQIASLRDSADLAAGLARLGASMTGLDFSAAAVGQARRLAERIGADARFVQADVYSAAEVLGRGAFDLVFTGIGALCRLPGIRR